MLVNLFKSFIISNNIVHYIYNLNILLPKSNIHIIIIIYFVKKKRTCPIFNNYFILKILFIYIIIYIVLFLKISMEHFNNYLINYYATLLLYILFLILLIEL